jgi:CBS-domain-containing membrane protein
MQAKDIMTSKVVTVWDGSSVRDIVGLLLKYRISALPVVDRAQRVVGIVSEGDLLRPEGAGAATTRRASWLEAVSAAQPVLDEKAQGRTASAVMTRDVLTIGEDTPLNEIAELLERNHIKRVPVTRDGKLVGIVSRGNLLHGLANTIVDHHEPGAARDRKLREELVSAILAKQELDTVLVNVIVRDGNVRLWGVIDNANQAEEIETIAKAVPGVKSVENNLGSGPMSGVPI